MVVIVVPGVFAEDVVDDCISNGTKNIIIISAGFGEIGKLELEKRPSRQEVLKKVPEKLREPLVEMRNQIDALSKEMIREGLVEGDLAAKITDNLGYYLTRTYRVHNDKKWTLENVPVEVKNRAINTIRKEFPNLTEDQLEGQLERLLIEQDMPLQTLNSGKKLGQKDLGILKKRVLEDKSIRDLLGEYKDPLYNYSNSVAKMSELLIYKKNGGKIYDLVME
ncbi:hypothetical protein, partial [Marivita sp.]|uniref:hypothetical protein n=1 Tax=Marivita sp. TaxID=2003365 RepID=UPI0025BCD6B0